jgi:hypothetical protein
MKKMILAFLVMVMFLIVGKANADGAWVLWEQGYSLADRSSSVPWHIVGAYPSHDACVEQESAICMRRQQLAIESKYWDDVKCIKSWGGHMLSISKGKGNPPDYKDFNSEWKCLPESVDPRK